MSETLILGLLPLVLVIGSDVWVYSDALKLTRSGTPVVYSSSVLTLRTPPSWFVACLVLWVVFFPVYLVGRSNDL